MQQPNLRRRGGAGVTPIPSTPRQLCFVLLFLAAFCSSVHASAVRRVWSESQSLRSLVHRHGGFVHADLRLAPSSPSSDPLSDVGVFTAASLPPHTVLLSVPHSMALTGDRAFETLSALLTEEQMAAVLDIQADNCEWIDWMMILYIAAADAFHDPQPAWWDATATASPFTPPNCPAPFFPVVAPPAASFPSSLHALWSHMISLYPRECVGVICLPLSVSVPEVLNEPLLLQRNHRHIQCVIQAREDIPRIESILAVCPSRMPMISRETLQWAAAMLLSRQQSIAAPSSASPSAASSPPEQRQAALLPFFDLFNTLPSAANHSHPRVYRTQDITLAPTTAGAEPDAATQAVTREEQIPTGSELFDLYGGAHPAPNLDLLVFYGFVPSDNAAASVTLALGFCLAPDSDVGTGAAESRRSLAVVHQAVDRMYTLFAGAPMDLRPHLSDAEIDRYAPLDRHDSDAAATAARATASAFRFDDCPAARDRHVVQSVLTRSGVSVTLLTLARLLVSTHKQLASPSFLASLLQPGAKSPLDARAEQHSLQLVLHWLLATFDGVEAEWRSTLQCAVLGHAEPLAGVGRRPAAPSRPTQMHVSVIKRQADTRGHDQAISVAMRQQMCRMKAAQMELLSNAAEQLRRLSNI